MVTGGGERKTPQNYMKSKGQTKKKAIFLTTQCLKKVKAIAP